jgi:hypothetical protein
MSAAITKMMSAETARQNLLKMRSLNEQLSVSNNTIAKTYKAAFHCRAEHHVCHVFLITIAGTHYRLQVPHETPFVMPDDALKGVKILYRLARNAHGGKIMP